MQKWNGWSCGKVPVRLISETWVATYSPRVQAVLFRFRWFVRGGGSSTAEAVTPDTGADESRKKMADIVARFPSRLCSRDGKICCYGDALSTIFLRAFVPCFLLFVFLFFLSFSLHPGMVVFFVSLRLCSSRLLLSASTCFMVHVLSACVICTLPHLEFFRFFVRLYIYIS